MRLGAVEFSLSLISSWYSCNICDRGFEKRAHLEQNVDCHTTLKYSSWASYYTLLCVCSCFHCWHTHIWNLRFVLLIYVHARLFEPIAEIVTLREVGPFLKSYHTCYAPHHMSLSPAVQGTGRRRCSARPSQTRQYEGASWGADFISSVVLE